MLNFLMNSALFVVNGLILWGLQTLASSLGDVPSTLIAFGGLACFGCLEIWAYRRWISN
jgi:uncharacterized membrane protein